jgi:purine-binding chemotaxis protein CheW
MDATNDNGNAGEFVTATVGDQLFGLPIACVQDVFKVERLTRIPLASPEIAGVVNLRGRIVTIIDLRYQLGLAPSENSGSAAMALGIAFKAESFGLLIDGVGEVLKLADGSREPNPVNLDARLARVSSGVHRLEDRLLVVLDIERVLDVNGHAAAA